MNANVCAVPPPVDGVTETLLGGSESVATFQLPLACQPELVAPELPEACRYVFREPVNAVANASAKLTVRLLPEPLTEDCEALSVH